MGNYNNIKKWLLPKLAAKKMSIDTLSQKSGISRTSIYNYLTDSSRPTASNMARICRAIGVPPEEGTKQYTDKTAGRPRVRRKRR